ncbi:hypothetical protein SprV_0401590800 [Sparganum proliferum]
MALRLPSWGAKFAVAVSAYASPITSYDKVKDKFYKNPRTLLVNLPKADKLFVLVNSIPATGQNTLPGSGFSAHLMLPVDMLLGPREHCSQPVQVRFGVPPLEFRGYPIDSNAIHSLSSKATAICDSPFFSSKRQLQRFLSMTNFYRRFLPNCSDMIMSLTSLLSGSKSSFKLPVDAFATSNNVKAALADTILLTHFAPHATNFLGPLPNGAAHGAFLFLVTNSQLWWLTTTTSLN